MWWQMTEPASPSRSPQPLPVLPSSLYRVLFLKASFNQFFDVCSQFSCLLSFPLQLAWKLNVGRNHLLLLCGPMVDAYYMLFSLPLNGALMLTGCFYIHYGLWALLNKSSQAAQTFLYPHFIDEETEAKVSVALSGKHEFWRSWLCHLLAIVWFEGNYFISLNLSFLII